MVIDFWSVQCLCIALVLGYSLSLCYLRHHIICLQEGKPPLFTYRCRSVPVANLGKREQGPVQTKSGDCKGREKHRKNGPLASFKYAKQKLTDRQKEELEAMNGFKERSKPEAKKKKMEKELQVIRGNYADLYEARSNMSAEGETKALFYFLIWDVLLFMFLGMAFFKMGILQGEAKTTVYVWMTVLGLVIGLPLSWLFVRGEVNYNFNWFEIVKNRQFAFYELQRLVHSIGIFGLIMLMYKFNLFKWFFALMRPVGQMAFTNYLAQSLLCGVFFYGIGFGFFGKLQRYELYYVVASVWLLEIIWSHLWLKYFRFGPLEWIWRSLTYWKKQPLRKNENVSSGAVALEV